MTSARWIAVGISVVATALLVAHLVWPNLTIDPFAIVLLGVAILPWLAPLFKAIELPGGLKVEFAELEKAEKLAESAGLLPPINETDKPVRKSEQVLSTTDPNLALASLRIASHRARAATTSHRSAEWSAGSEARNRRPLKGVGPTQPTIPAADRNRG